MNQSAHKSGSKSGLLLAFIVGLTFSLPAAAKLYKWVDDQGITHYGETIPPEYAHKDRAELNKSGRVVNKETVPTPEEREAKKLAEAKGNSINGLYEAELEGRSLRIKGDARSAQAVNEFKAALAPLLASAELGEVKSRPDGTVTFSLTGTLKEGTK